MDSYLHMIFHVLTLLWAKKVTSKTRTDNQNVHKPNRILILVEREGNMKSLQMCWMMISHKKQTKKTPISNIKGSLFCTRMCGNPGRTKRIDIIREKCLFYRHTDWHRARRQRKKKGLQSYSERFGRGSWVSTKMPSFRPDGPLLTEQRHHRATVKTVKNPEGGNHPTTQPQSVRSRQDAAERW